VKTIKRKAKRAALVWKEFGLTAGYHSHTARAAKGSYCITRPLSGKYSMVISSRKWMAGDARHLCGKPGHGGTEKLDEAKAIAQADHDAGRDW
jgi:hypothetical protein